MATTQTCWGCGAISKPDMPFKACSRCRDENFQPSFFCGKECLALRMQPLATP